jgi:hypothetical protein
MCEITTALAIGTAISAASAGAQLIAQQQAASAQGVANQRTYDSQMQALRVNQANSNFARAQESENLADQRFTNDMAAVRAQSTARTAAGEAGVTGLSVDALLADLAGRAGRDNVNAETNYLRRDAALQADAFNNYSTAANNINKLTTPQNPDYLGAALRIGSAAVDYRVQTGMLGRSNSGTEKVK